MTTMWCRELGTDLGVAPRAGAGALAIAAPAGRARARAGAGALARGLAALVALGLGGGACGGPPAPAAPRGGSAIAPAPAGGAAGGAATEAPAERLYRYLIGAFDSGDQAARDGEFRTIHLAICPADAPELGPRVLYVEQAAAEARDQPYRQRLYVIEDAPGGAAVSRVLELRDPGPAIGACGRAAPPRFAAADAEERAGCAVTMAWQPAQRAWTGGTRERDCASSLRGAAYATSEVQLDGARLVSWDRGYDAAGAQVWGAVKGPYEFTRRTPPP
jgi:hypothetical protein